MASHRGRRTIFLVWQWPLLEDCRVAFDAAGLRRGLQVAGTYTDYRNTQSRKPLWGTGRCERNRATVMGNQVPPEGALEADGDGGGDADLVVVASASPSYWACVIHVDPAAKSYVEVPAGRVEGAAAEGELAEGGKTAVVEEEDCLTQLSDVEVEVSMEDSM